MRYAWQQGCFPVTLPSQGNKNVKGVWQEKYAPVTRNWLILRWCDGVTGKNEKTFIRFLLLYHTSNVFTLLYERKYENGHFSIPFYALNLYANSYTMALLAKSNGAAPFLTYGMVRISWCTKSVHQVIFMVNMIPDSFRS